MEFGEGLSDSMRLMEVFGFGFNLFWMEMEKFVFWIWDKEHNNQTFQMVLLKDQLLDLLLHIFL